MELLTPNFSAERYDRELSAAYMPGRTVYDPDFGTRSDHWLWHKVRRDPVILGAFDLRRSEVSNTEWRCASASEKPADRKLALVVEAALKEIPDLDEARFHLAEAIVRGSSYQWINWRQETMELGPTPMLTWNLPASLQHVDRNRFRVYVSGRDGIPRWQSWDYASHQWETLTPEVAANLVKVTYGNTEDSMGYGRGLLEAIYFFFYAKGQLLQKGLDGADAWAKGVMDIGINGMKDGSAGKINTALVTAWENVADRARSRHALVHDKDDEVNWREGGSTGNSIVMTLIYYLDRAITRLILASTLVTGAGESDSGSLAQSETHERSKDKLIRRDRKKVDQGLSNDLIGQFCRMNKNNLARCGLGQARPPKFESVVERLGEAGAEAQTAATLLGAGIDLRRDEVYRKCGYTPPDDDDIVIEGTKQPDPAMLGADPGDGPSGEAPPPKKPPQAKMNGGMKRANPDRKPADRPASAKRA